MLTKEKIKEILSNRIEELSSSKLPHFLLLSDIKKATKRVIDAINNKEKIAIVGDYDVDGVSSLAIMKLFFEKIGVDVEVIIPNRFEDGYGLTKSIVEKIDANLIITVDNGISSFEGANECKKKGIDLIITDHHTPFDTLPDAFAIINPKISPDFPFKEICGAEVAWYFCASIKNYLKLDVDLREFCDILAIAIIADVMPLTHMNKTLVLMGLKRLNKANKAFSKALKKFFNKEFKSEDIAFQIAPRLNAAGRISSAYVAYEFLISKDENEAFLLLMELDRLNNLRKDVEKEIIESIEEIEDKFIVVKGDFHEGVIGIVASRLVHKYKKPAIVFSKKDGVLKGSGRSLGNVDIFSLVSECKELIIGFGGHKMACGLSIEEEKFEDFKELINKKVLQYKEDDFFIEDYVLGEIKFSEIDLELLDILESFEPYGEANPKPKFIATAKVEHIQNLKDNHYKLILSQDDIILPAVIFRFDGEFDEILTFKFSISENSYYGRSVQLIIEEIL